MAKQGMSHRCRGCWTDVPPLRYNYDARVAELVGNLWEGIMLCRTCEAQLNEGTLTLPPVIKHRRSHPAEEELDT